MVSSRLHCEKLRASTVLVVAVWLLVYHGFLATSQIVSSINMQRIGTSATWLSGSPLSPSQKVVPSFRVVFSLRGGAVPTTNNRTTGTTLTRTSIIQVIETEIRVNGTWKHPPSQSKTNFNGDADSVNNDIDVPWMDATTLEPVPPPMEHVLAPNQEWVGEWKILVQRQQQQQQQASRYAQPFMSPSLMHGWYYSRRETPSRSSDADVEMSTDAASSVVDTSRSSSFQGQRQGKSPLLPYTHRRRIWLRTVATTTTTTTRSKGKSKSTKSLSATSLTRTDLRLKSELLNQKQQRPPQRHGYRHPGVLSKIRDDFNFKGLGVTCSKSLVFGDSFGLAMRLPLTLNFATWERYSSWPSIGSSIAIYGRHPWTIALLVHMSMRLEHVQCLSRYISATLVPTVVTGLLRILVHGWLLALSALLYPLTRQAPTFPMDQGTEWHRLWTWPEPLRSRRDSEERLTVSFSWRWSWPDAASKTSPLMPFSRWLPTNHEFRTMYSHYLAIQLVTLWEALVVPAWTLWTTQVARPKRKHDSETSLSAPHWMSRHSAALGCTLSGPLRPSESGVLVTATSLLSLSGFYPPILSLFRSQYRSTHRTDLDSVVQTTIANTTTGLQVDAPVSINSAGVNALAATNKQNATKSTLSKVTVAS
jgi:hypothetical protein